MRNYELAYIARPDLDEESLSELQGKIQSLIEGAGGTVVEVDQWGRRRMAYPIEDHRDGYYYFVQSKMPTDGPASVEQDLKVFDGILRYMLVRRDE